MYNSLISQLPQEVFACGFSVRKRAVVRRFMGNVKVRFIQPNKSIPKGSTVLLWGSFECLSAMAAQVNIIRLEDGFIRSVGLGADLVKPISWVMDSRGIYYDATRPSDLEYLLSTTVFDEELLARASSLRERIVATGLTKYNVGKGEWQKPSESQCVILVPGQVESDASIKYGALGIRTNLKLLQSVRQENPHAFILYKPHPDVVAGLRKQGIGENDATLWCNQIITDATMSDLLKVVDEVHVLTSLTGFEALMRGKRVVCYGQPFYAGWGLTEDKIPFSRRVRKLTLDELVAATLILYPTYVSLNNAATITPEQALDELLAWRENANQITTLWHQLLRFFLRRRAY